jgi:hypothetical protein
MAGRGHFTFVDLDSLGLIRGPGPNASFRAQAIADDQSNKAAFSRSFQRLPNGLQVCVVGFEGNERQARPARACFALGSRDQVESMIKALNWRGLHVPKAALPEIALLATAISVVLSPASPRTTSPRPAAPETQTGPWRSDAADVDESEFSSSRRQRRLIRTWRGKLGTQAANCSIPTLGTQHTFHTCYNQHSDLFALI